MSEWLERNTVYKGAILSVDSGRVRVGQTIVHFDVIEHHGGVAVVPLLGDRVLLVRQPRPVIGKDLLEIPAGKREGPDDDTEARAQAELGEEVGYRAGRLVPAADFYVSPGYTTERIIIYLGLDLEPVEAAQEASEDIERVELSLDEMRHMLAIGAFHDSKTIIGLRELLAYVDREEK